MCILFIESRGTPWRHQRTKGRAGISRGRKKPQATKNPLPSKGNGVHYSGNIRTLERLVHLAHLLFKTFQITISAPNKQPLFSTVKIQPLSDYTPPQLI